MMSTTAKKTTQFSAVNKGAARYALLLDCLADHYPNMLSLADIGRLTNLPKPTAFRLMKALEEVGFVAYDTEQQAYFFGAKMMELGLKALAQNFAVIARPSLMRIADETRDTAFGVLAQNDHMHCLLRITGSYPVRTLSLEVGDIWPLGVGAVGMALLAAYDDDFIERFLKSHLALISHYAPLTSDVLRERVRHTREHGYALSEGDLLSGMSAIGVVVRFPGTGRPMGAISVAALSSRLESPRREEIANLLRREADAMASTLAAARPIPIGGLGDED